MSCHFFGAGRPTAQKKNRVIPTEAQSAESNDPHTMSSPQMGSAVAFAPTFYAPTANKKTRHPDRSGAEWRDPRIFFVAVVARCLSDGHPKRACLSETEMGDLLLPSHVLLFLPDALALVCLPLSSKTRKGKSGDITNIPPAIYRNNPQKQPKNRMSSPQTT
jgi:hypothetical protein